MAIACTCLDCSGNFRAPDNLAGKWVKCPHCGKPCQIESPSPSSSALSQISTQPAPASQPPIAKRMVNIPSAPLHFKETISGQHDGPPREDNGTIRRKAHLRCFYGAAVAAAIVAPFLDSQRGPTGFSEVGVAAGVACGMIAFGLIMTWLYAAAGEARMGLSGLAGMGAGFGGAYLGSVSGPIYVPAGALIVAIVLFLIEQSIELEIGDNGLEMRQWFPWNAVTTLAWDEIETIRADLRILVSGSVFHNTVTYENYLVIEGKRKRIRFNTTTFEHGERYVAGILARGRPSAIRWTLAQAATLEGANLGPIRVKSDRLAWSRILSFGRMGSARWIFHFFLGAFTCGAWWAIYGIWLLVMWAKGFDSVPLTEMEKLTVAEAILTIHYAREGKRKQRRLHVQQVRNGLFLPDIVATLLNTAG